MCPFIASGRQIAINGHIKFNLTIPLQQLNGLETLVIIMVANKYAFLQITRRRFLNEWEAFKKVISRRNIRRRITIPLTLSNLKLLRRITRTENILHRNFTRRQVAILFSFSKNHFSSPSGRWSIVLLISSWGSTLYHCANSSINFSVTDTNSSRTSEAALWPSTYISPLSNSTPCIRKDRISSKSLMRLSICLWKPSIGD